MAQTQQPAESAADINRVSADGARLARNSSISEAELEGGDDQLAGTEDWRQVCLIAVGSRLCAHTNVHTRRAQARTHADRWAGKIGKAATLITSRDCIRRREMIFHAAVCVNV